jgi:signal transduction histidine kinase
MRLMERMEETVRLPAVLAPDSKQKRLALIAALLVPVPFIAIIPFGQIELPRVDSYIPVVDTVMLINDAIAATLLFAQFSILRAPSLLALAGGFLFTALLVVPHALTFPGAFAPEGLLGAGLQTTPWLNEFWFIGLPVAVIACALLKRYDATNPIPPGAVPLSIFMVVTLVAAVTMALLWLTTEGADWLPAIMSDPIRPGLAWHFLPLVVLSGTAIVLLWSRRQSALDLWLLVVLEAWLLNALMFNTLVVRFSVFWYFGRVFSALTTSLVLLVLIAETTVLYWRLARANTMLERERDQKLLNAQAITASIAHEIRQPLGAMVANGEAGLLYLEKVPPDLDKARTAFNRMISDGHRTSEVLEAMRALFQKADQQRQRVDVNATVLKALRVFGAELEILGIDLRTELEAGLPLVDGHEGQLEDVLVNLIRNAIEAMDTPMDRGRMLRLATGRTGHDAISVAVQDSGPGIDPKKIDGVFNAFVTTKSHGTGLGLAICRMIVERHGGQLNVSSDGKSGALFHFDLPIGSVAETAAGAD